MKIKLSVGYKAEQRLLNQTPNACGIWEGCEFLINQDVEECDAWVVLQSSKGLLKRETTKCPPENLILITREPPDMMSWTDAYIKQFGMVITCHPNIKHPHRYLTQHGQTWFVSKYSFDELAKLQHSAKPKLLSVICSNKTFTEGHRNRLNLLKILKSHFKELEVFGRDSRPIKDKWDGIYPYKYHIVLENGSFPHYWTEKLSDAYLGYSLPIYYGCPNLNDYFSPESFIRIHQDNIDLTIHNLEQAINNNYYENSLSAIIEARNLVLYRYNLFPMLVDLCSNLLSSNQQKITLRPDFEFKLSVKKKITEMYSFLAKKIH